MIGSLHQFEKSFGHMWGIDKEKESDLTNEEIHFLDKWEMTRNNILNNGNNQFRQTMRELSGLLSGSTKHSYNLKTNRKGKTNEE
jgi:hypothetical protein